MVNRVTLFGISGRDKFTGLLQIEVSQEDVSFNRQACRNSYSLTHHKNKTRELGAYINNLFTYISRYFMMTINVVLY